MQIIKKIKISYFRSFSKTVTVDNIKDLNVFSGKNDSGKSNFLKALNLFFTEDSVDFYNHLVFERDFSKIRKDEASQGRHKQKIQIAILFNRETFSGAVLPDEFWVEKEWDREGNLLARKIKDNKNKLLKHNGATAKVEASVTSYLKKIHFLYVPAIKDGRFFDFLKRQYQASLVENADAKIDATKMRTLNDWKDELSVKNITDLLAEKIDVEAKEMMASFRGGTSEIQQSNFAIPELDYSKVLEVMTEKEIPLTSRGDGVQAKFIPQILNEITKNNKARMVIWGFEEPENSYEYANAQALANLFKDEFSKEKQIFITSHAFNFISMSGDNVSTYRAWKETYEQGTQIKHIDADGDLFSSSDSEKLQEELGIFSLNKELEALFLAKEEEFKHLKQMQDELKNQQKPILYVEDQHDGIYKISWLKLNGFEAATLQSYSDLFDKNAPFSILKACGASNLEGFLKAGNIDYWKDKKVVGLFDFDEAGRQKFRNLKVEWGPIMGTQETGFVRQRNENHCFYALLLPVPSRLESFANCDFHSYVEIEHLLPQEFLLDKCFAEKTKIAGGSSYLKIKEKKAETLRKELFSLQKEDFHDFQPLFAKVFELLGLLPEKYH